MLKYLNIKFFSKLFLTFLHESFQLFSIKLVDMLANFYFNSYRLRY